MEHPRIDDDKIVDRYLVGRLPPADEARFEEHLFECADCLEKVESGEEMRRGLRSVAAEDASRAAVSKSLFALGLAAWLSSRRPGQLAGLVGLVLALVLLPAVVLWQQAELSRVREVARQAVAGSAGLSEPMGNFLVVSLGMVRDADTAVEVRPDPEKAVLLSLELEVADAARYQVTLIDAAGVVLWQGDDLEPNLYDTLVVILPPSFLAPGSYHFTVEALTVAGVEPAGEMGLRVLAER